MVALFSCYVIGVQIGSKNSSYRAYPFFGLYDTLHHCTDLIDEDGFYYGSECEIGLRMLAMTLPFLSCFLILLWEMLSCCCCCFCCCKRRRSFKIRPRPTQLWYRTYLGVQGSHYAFKVAALQFLTVVMQGLAKASLFRTIQDTHGSESLRASTAVSCFIVLLLCNILFPAMILVIPNYVFSRVGAALLDAVLDVGYMVTSIWLYVVFATTGSLTDIFLSSFLNYMSIYMCIAHVLCVCRSLETADWIVLFQVPRTPPTGKAWKRILFSTAYVAFVSILLGGIVLGAFTSHDGLCPPCQCAAVAPTSLLLERCVIRTGYVAQAAGRLEFNLTNRNITKVLPNAFIARGAHQKVRSISLRGNHLTELPEGLFRDLPQQEEDDWGSPDINIVDLADNRIATLPPGLFQAGSSGESTVIVDLHLEGNCLTTLPPGVFYGLRFVYRGILNISHNQLQVLHAAAFHGLKFEGNDGILDMSQNKLQDLPPKVFDGSSLGSLNLSHNELVTLAWDAFSGLSDLRSLRLEGNRLRSLGGRPFYWLIRLEELNLEQNQLTELDEDVFISNMWNSNTLKRNLLELNLGGNRLIALPAGLFNGFRSLRTLQLQSNQLERLPPKLFQTLGKFRLAFSEL